VDVRNGKLNINPHLPKHWRSIKFNLSLQENQFAIQISQNELKVKYEGEIEKIAFWVNGKEKAVARGQVSDIEI
jgi:trehalose/maltose hydrolase-like predicted phosphorylase